MESASLELFDDLMDALDSACRAEEWGDPPEEADYIRGRVEAAWYGLTEDERSFVLGRYPADEVARMRRKAS